MLVDNTLSALRKISGEFVLIYFICREVLKQVISHFEPGSD